ncbi:hypothetical protein N0V91_002310 [Didymella pomorum]|uniref:Uncharacterized protein n=1 Tax=Didymella pomorum TaxID=749634 RepID=A0A9W8ZIR6_9PLEO|nr:hypothetical protein N0V91_002310 [Didymella pomorum]
MRSVSRVAHPSIHLHTLQEIRNHIYKLALEDLSNAAAPISIFYCGPTAVTDYKNRPGLALLLHGTVSGMTIDFGVEARDLTPVSSNVSEYPKFPAFIAERTYEVVPILAQWYGGKGDEEYVEPLALAVRVKRKMGEDWMDDPYLDGLEVGKEGLVLACHVKVRPKVDQQGNMS